MTKINLPTEFYENARKLRIYRGKLASSIGLLVMQFNSIEHDIGELLAVFLKRNSQDDYFNNISIMTAALSFSQKLDMLSALYLKRYESNQRQCEVFRKIIIKLSKFEEYRNTHIHSRWGTRSFGDSEFKRFKPNVKGRKGLRNAEEVVDWKEIREKCKEMSEFNCNELFEIYRGCSEYCEMSEETLSKLENRLTFGSSRPSGR